MLLEFPEDPGTHSLDRQYMLGADLLVAPVFSEDGTVEYYVPEGTWTNVITGERVSGPGWRRERMVSIRCRCWPGRARWSRSARWTTARDPIGRTA